MDVKAIKAVDRVGLAAYPASQGFRLKACRLIKS
jgi:hypothetical protein